MFFRVRLLTLGAALLAASAPAHAQATWQPAPVPLVTAENTTWFQSGEPITWDGGVFYPAGARRAFNPYQMVRSGSFRGIPLYTDATLEPNSIVFVPLAGAIVQPYERRRTGALAGTLGSLAPSLPTTIGVEGTQPEIAQAAAPPTYAPPYEVPAPAARPVATAPVEPAPVGTSGTTPPPERVATSGRPRIVTITNRPPNAKTPKGISGAWIEYNGRKWVASGWAVDLSDQFALAGAYRGFPVYRLDGDSSTIYVPTTPGLVVPFKAR